jgi:phosphatidylserine/phosphatidylglycerophosphate/cardiolipin synthase-like enzyme
VLPVLVAVAVVTSLGAGAAAPAGTAGAGAGPPASSDEARIIDVYPNPPTHGDKGEFVRLWLPPGADLSEYALADDQVTVPLATGENQAPPRPPPGGGSVTFSTHPNLTAAVTDRRVAPLSDRLQLANGGDHVRLLHNGTVVDDVSFDRATEGEVYNATTGQWRSLGATDRPVVTAGSGEVEVFVLPDEPDRAIEALRSADDRILLAGYTLSSRRVVDALLAADRRGVTVEVLVEDSPVGGMSERAAAALDDLVAAGIPVRVSGGQRARYRFHHAKYAVVDDRALVTTENWKPSGVGGRSSRGWAVLTDQEPIVEGLADTFRADAGWADAIPWNTVEDASVVEDEPADGEHPSNFDARSVPVQRTKLLVTPDNAEQELVALLEDAEKSIAIKQVRIGSRDFRLLEAALDAAERGVEVRILLSSAWYVREENQQLATWLEEQAETGELPLSVRLADPDGRFEKIHAKGLLVDGETVAVGSVNWNANSLRENREVVLVLEGEAAAGYFGEVFDADWTGGGGSNRPGSGHQLPLGLALACLAAAVLAILVAARLRFER